MTKPNILFVCGRNKKRSRTAESIFKNDDRFAVRSAGLSKQSDRRLSEKDLHWADLVLVMESGYKSRIVDQYRHLELPPIENLEIPDDYEYMDQELIEILEDRMEDVMNKIEP